MLEEGSVSIWLQELRSGNTLAAQELWERYFARLLVVARDKLRGVSRRATDEEDVALSAFHSFCAGVAQSRFPRLDNRDDLWQVLVMLTARKAFQERRRQQTLKRGGLVTDQGKRLTANTPTPVDWDLDEVVGAEPNPEFVAMMAEQFTCLLDILPEEILRQVARLRLENYTNSEIAERLNCSERTVERKLSLIRGYWNQTQLEES